MTLAEQITHDVLKLTGFREPKEHPDWDAIVDKSQDRIDEKMEMMKRVVQHDVDMQDRHYQRKSKLGKILTVLRS